MKTIRILLALCAALTLLAQNAHKAEAKKEIVLACETSLVTAPVWIAESKGYFQEKGVKVRIKEFDSGKASLAAMLKNKDIDICTVANTPIVFKSFERDDFVIIAAMLYSDNIAKVLARTDKGIRNPRGLESKRVGITKGTTGQFFLDAFLTFRGIVPSKVAVVDLKPSELPKALAEGGVDAICTWEPHILTAKQLLGNKAHILLGEGIYRAAFYFVARRDFAENNPEALKGFLRAIQKGEELIQREEDKSIDIVCQRLGSDRKLTESIWGDFVFQLMLDQMILMSLEDVARWAIKQGLTTQKEVPNYLDYIYMDALDEVRPEAVTIIR
ncbi:MAG: NrtA/SsuA/CpmA family ABC transporter substrate-binding protein [Desulfobacteraceae bacterium]|nr:NrtA/SsuA/CpmA family ABC transporter substrate-binding protein [Desulfobacteraceae bacterium]